MITSSLASLEMVRVVEEDASDLIRFGLDPARIEVAFRAADATEMQRLLIGNRTPTGSDIYARTPDNRRVFLLGSYIDSTFNRNTFGLRDKHILQLERGAAETVEMTKGSTVLEFARSGNDWNIVRPIAARGDFGLIESVVERLSSGQMQGIVADEASDLRKYGLDKPTATIVVRTGSARATLTLGATENALVYAKDAARPMIFTVAPTLETDLFKPVEDFRRRDLFDSRAFTATRLEIVRSGDTLAFEKTKKDESEIWQRVGGAEIDTTAMDDLLGRVTALRASSFEPTAPAALRSPALRVTIRFGEGKTETVAFGRSGDDVFASRSGEPGAARVDAAAFDEAIAALDAVKS
jgi:hypothetical protein